VSDKLASDDDEATLRGDHVTQAGFSDDNNDLRFFHGSRRRFHGPSPDESPSALCFRLLKDDEDDVADVNFLLPTSVLPRRLPVNVPFFSLLSGAASMVGSVLFFSMLSRAASLAGFDADCLSVVASMLGFCSDCLASLVSAEVFAWFDFFSMTRFSLLADVVTWPLLGDFKADE